MKKPCTCQEKLPPGFAPGPLDVICARGKQAKSHPGNIRYQKIIESYMDRYVAATSKLQKMSIISEVVTKIRFASPDGGFVKLKEGGWYEGMLGESSTVSAVLLLDTNSSHSSHSW